MLMDSRLSRRLTGAIVTAALMLAMVAAPVFGHCDSEDGPIIPLIRSSLDNGDITPLLKWLRVDDEAEIKALFARVRALRSQSEQAREIADRLFVETFIRLHRAGEGASYTGIKAAGEIPAIFGELDAALESGSVDTLADRVAEAVRTNIKERFDRAAELKKHQDDSVEDGRAFVEAYVSYMHFVEGLHEYLNRQGSGHHTAATGHDN